MQDAVALRGRGRRAARRALAAAASLSANCVLVASGVSYRQLDAPGFAALHRRRDLLRRGADRGRSCADQHVVVIGGANSAGQAAVYFSGYARRVIDARARRLAGQVDVALPDRADRGAAQRRGAHRRPGGRGRGRGRPPARAADPRRATAARALEEVDAVLRVHRRGAAHRLAGRRRGPRRARLHPRRRPTSRGPAGRCRATLTRWRRACPACSWPATCAPARSSAWPARSARARWRCRSSTSTSAQA